MKPSPCSPAWPRALALSALVGALGSACAQVQPPPQNIVTLSASATTEVTKDWLTLVFSTTREGADAALVQAQLKQALEAALAEAKKVARPGQLEVQTGAFSLFPRYAPNPKAASGGLPGGIVGWQGSTELIVEGRDFQAIAQLTGRVQTLTIARVASSLSRQARQQLEGDVSAQAIDRFRARADAVARQFGFAGYTVREVSVATDAPMGLQFAAPRQVAMQVMASAEPLPVEVGKASVTANVSGSVQMK